MAELGGGKELLDIRYDVRISSQKTKNKKNRKIYLEERLDLQLKK